MVRRLDRVDSGWPKSYDIEFDCQPTGGPICTLCTADKISVDEKAGIKTPSIK